MRFLKKIMAITLVVAMMMSVMSVGVFAAATNVTLTLTPSADVVKTGATVTVTLNGKADADTGIALAGAVITYDAAKFEAAADFGVFDPALSAIDDTTGRIYLTTMTAFNLTTDDTALATFTFTAKEVAEDVAFDVVEFEGCWSDSTWAELGVAVTGTTVDIIEGFIATTATIAETETSVAYGTAADAIVLPAAATIANADGSKSVTAPVTDWTSADYDANTAGEYTFTGKVAAGEYDAATVEADIPVSYKVTVNKVALTADMITTVLAGEIKQNVEAADGAAIVAALPVKAAVSGAAGDVEYDIAWEIPAEPVDISAVGTEIVVNGSIEGAGNYEGTVAVEGKVIVVEPTFEATIAEIAETVEVELGTSKEDLLAALAAVKATVYDETKEKSEADYAVTDWVLTAYNNAALGSYEVTGTVTSIEGNNALFDTLTVTATVVVGPITLTSDMAKTVLKGNIMMSAEPVEGAVIVAVLPTKTTVEAGAFTDEYDIVWTVPEESVDISVKDAEIIVTGTITGADNFKGEATVTGTVKVVANIPDASMTISGSKTSKPSVKVAIPKDKVEAGNEITIEIANEDGDISTITYVIDAADIPAEGDVEVKFTGSKTFGDLGFSAGDKYYAVAYLDGIILGEIDEDGNPVPVTGTIRQVSSNGGTKLPSGGSAGGVTPSDPTDPTTPADPTDPTDPTTPADPTDPTDPTTPAEPVVGGFTDVPESHWSAEFIKALLDAGIVNGKTETSFDPEGTVTRAEYTKMIVLALGIEATSTEVAFEDCAADAWYTPFVAAAVEAGLVNGTSETTFSPDALVTREQMAAILYRALASKTTVESAELTFTDADAIEDYAVEAVEWAVGAGIINGNPDGTFAPADSATRAQAAKVIASALALLTPAAE